MTFARPAGAVATEDLPAYARHLLDAAQRLDRTALTRRRFLLPRLELDVAFASEDFLRLCEGAFQESTAAPLATARVFALHAEAGRWPTALHWRDTAEMSPRRLDLSLGTTGLRGSYHDLPSWQVYDPAAGTGVQSLSAPLAFPPWESTAPLRLFLHWAYAAAGLRLTHAATLGQDGDGVLLAGAGGAGKSGTTLAGLLHGLASCGDDYVLVEPGAPVVAHAVLRKFKQDVAGLERVGLGTLAREIPLNWQDKIELDPARLGRPLAQRMNIRAILLPRIARTRRTTLVPASAQQAALALAPSAVLQFAGDSREGFRFFADLARDLPAFHLHLSEEPEEIAAAIAALLEKGVAHAG